jgi:septal ring factor EnvC (AmiA/AmiB activator)
MPLTHTENDSAALKRFHEPSPDGPTPVETAIQISDKYASLSEEASILRQENSHLKKQNIELETKLNDINAKFFQTEKELKEANDMLIDMRIELNNWKIDVLSFRDEMRDADKAQLSALLKILRTLGGDIAPEDSTVATEMVSDPNGPHT